ncbi:ATP-binding protein [Segatella paludivivens]|uniref:ATP-binding protein n=1 Tax=Segatella paludivivens TaxID=185294 RepID=UPI0009DD3A01|nr:ATP-binding protein [Segatella paludivivens]
MDANTRLKLLQILEERYELRSVIIVSLLPINKWYDYIEDSTFADAILCRLVSNANTIEIRGESMRYKKKK